MLCKYPACYFNGRCIFSSTRKDSIIILNFVDETFEMKFQFSSTVKSIVFSYPNYVKFNFVVKILINLIRLDKKQATAFVNALANIVLSTADFSYLPLSSATY